MGKIYNTSIAVLFFLVGVLFYLQLKKPVSATTRTVVSGGASLPIAYFEQDSIFTKSKFSADKLKDLQAAIEKANDELSKLDAEFDTQNKIYEAMPEGDEKEKALLALQDLKQKKDIKKETAEQNMESAKQKVQMEMRKNIESYIKKINTPQRFSMIILYDPSFIFFKDSALDVTNEIIDGLNKAYK